MGLLDSFLQLTSPLYNGFKAWYENRGDAAEGVGDFVEDYSPIVWLSRNDVDVGGFGISYLEIAIIAVVALVVVYFVFLRPRAAGGSTTNIYLRGRQ